MEILLKLINLKKYFLQRKFLFETKNNIIKAVDGISLELKRGEILGIVGESGSGKSTLAKTIIKLYEPDNGSIIFNNIDITKLPEKKLKYLRKDFQIVFQNPYSSLNPRMTVGEIISEPIIIYKKFENLKLSKNEIKEKVINLLEKVGLNKYHLNRYPHEFSGGQRQRISIARALALNPKLLICDEPISSLDVSIQSQILNLLLNIQASENLTYIFISHDLSVVKHFSDRVAVMYLGKIVEIAPNMEIFDNPLHPYTKILLSNIPIPDPLIETKKRKILIKGEINYPEENFKGCKFSFRCPLKTNICIESEPNLFPIYNNHYVSCFHYNEINSL